MRGKGRETTERSKESKMNDELENRKLHQQNFLGENDQNTNKSLRSPVFLFFIFFKEY